MPARILLALTSHGQLADTGRRTGFYVSEAAHPWRVFHAAGHQVDIVSVRGGQPPQDGLDPSDPVQTEFLSDPAVTAQLSATPSTGDIDASAYDAILYVGGHGTMWDFPHDEQLAALGRGIYESGGVVAAVCHGPAGLLPLTLSDGSHLIAGKRVTGFSNSEEEAVGLTAAVPFLLQNRLRDLGGDYRSGPDFAPHVVTDGRLVTGQNPASADGVARAVLDALHAAAR
ncbi:type 1 glutamine amidotransferase domain-containing protein [Actinoplanes sp. NPDC051346]|uniref:type 1 glutamine amidotransferase domain-containing protein n=1 Tax=Actinoplanes sp. NPDC051346 TaxID=3155048 RepID=UPI00341A395C